ncbi:tyrosine-type recombinase/integrase [Dyella caseinilytica]|uniref:Integrase arm-type DNA-binding domain-containing protein n=1 Tax=Dyella caseinilytica TaxID=1849581 RepID=A0ABX7GU42_9GAMM|nr:integrase arm-type DNA-binding domain-containing protein [Dyella caseinilytica]QRN53536.1 integrase arm-type DNA-binding domain-containing protein [Dyella caseinilytica]GFZ87145.1 integrase [Dyella caseinilytica]
MLTDAKLRALKPRDKVYRIADTNGLCIEVRPTGAKLWRYRYRHAGKASMAALGEYPGMPLAKARAERDKARSLVKRGTSPAHVAKAERATKLDQANNTFAAVALEFLAKREKEGMGANSVERGRRLVEKDLASIGNLPIVEVSAPILLAALRKMEQRGIVESAHRARGLAGQIFRYAIATGRAERNPAADLIGALERPKTKHFASIVLPSKIGELLRAIHSYQGSPATVAALKLAPLVFVRPNELRHAEWSEIDLNKATWDIAAVKMKMKQPHLVPLSDQAVVLLRELHPLTGSGKYVFPGTRSMRRPMSENTINAALRYMGFDSNTMTGHGFRAMARTVLDEELGFPVDHIEHQLAHAVKDANGRAYNRTTHLPARRKMMQAWADYLDLLKARDNVLPIRRKA